MSIKSSFKIPYHSPMIRSLLQQELLSLISHAKPHQPIVIVCIGTDRSTGDSLGPLVGSQLLKYRSSFFHVYGTIAEPVHALNLSDVLTVIHTAHPTPFIIGIDACLGQTSSVGSIITALGPVK